MTMPHLTSRIFNTPLAIMPEKAAVILQAIGPRLGIGEVSSTVSVNLDASLFEQEAGEDEGYTVSNGVAVIPIHGTLVQRGAWLGSYSGMTSYQGIRHCFNEAMNDASVKAIYLEIDSPGGEVSGLFDLVDAMAARVGEKPIHAHINELSASAAFALTTVADHISVARTGLVGSVGVIVIHTEYSKMLDKDGIKVNVIRAGERKADMNPYEQLNDTAREDVQSEVDYVRGIFVETVARNLEVDAKKIWETEAAVFTAPKALELGLVDAVMSTEQAATHLVAVMG